MSEYSNDPARVAGPNADGSQSLARESKLGQLTTFGLAVAGTAVLGYLNQLDLTTLPGWLAGAATLAVSTIGGTITAWLAKNR